VFAPLKKQPADLEQDNFQAETKKRAKRILIFPGGINVNQNQ
jgi:hypothetical protein